MTAAVPARTRFLGQTLLVWVIALYRRFLSGRGPLARVRCTFSSSETCSAYALRVTRSFATALPAALRLIRNRLRACRDASLYRSAAGLVWGELHDRTPGDIDRVASAAGETAATRALLLRSRAIVARYCGDLRALRVAVAAAAPLTPRSSIVVRSHVRPRGPARERAIAAGAMIAASVASGVAVAAGAPWMLAVAGIACAIAAWKIAAARRAARHARRIEDLEAANRFSR